MCEKANVAMSFKLSMLCALPECPKGWFLFVHWYFVSHCAFCSLIFVCMKCVTMTKWTIHWFGIPKNVEFGRKVREGFSISSYIVLLPSQLVNSHLGPAEPLIWTGTEQRHNMVPKTALAVGDGALHRTKLPCKDVDHHRYATKTCTFLKTCAFKENWL